MVMDNGNIESFQPRPGEDQSKNAFWCQFRFNLIRGDHPNIESKYRVLTDRETEQWLVCHGDFKHLTYVEQPDKFAYIGGFSGAGRIDTNQLDTAYNGAFKDPKAFNESKSLFIGIGSNPERTKLSESLKNMVSTTFIMNLLNSTRILNMA